MLHRRKRLYHSPAGARLGATEGPFIEQLGYSVCFVPFLGTIDLYLPRLRSDGDR